MVENEKNILSCLGTGHGKTIIILLIGMALNGITGKKVYIVCLNNFLKNYATTIYAQNVSQVI